MIADPWPLAPLQPGDWRWDALCAETDPEAFFPLKGGTTAPAKAICARCTVAAECLAYALLHDERFGIWGGLSERQRRRMKRAGG
ncbi:WhiB family transcriptional regulator [Microbacterium panaciterrae]|uniref:Transcriptional regulator WhiB n=1 Tax=Microbacterium panaciterrae TaxID=985759 RepID=A0ABP8P8M7_9MICO